jgi:hypothetical protein
MQCERDSSAADDDDTIAYHCREKITKSTRITVQRKFYSINEFMEGNWMFN